MAAGDVAIFDRFARYYDRLMPAADAVELGRALDVADRPLSVLVDVGGGSGRAAQALNVDERIVIDAARGMATQASTNGLPAIQGDASRLPLADRSVDAITVVDALHHMYDWERVFTEAYRVLRPGGVLAISDFDPTTVLGRGLAIGERLVGFDSQFESPQSICRRLEAVGFETLVVDAGFGYTVAGLVPKQENKNRSTES